MTAEPPVERLGFPVKGSDLEFAALTLRRLGCRLLRDVLDGGKGLDGAKWFPGPAVAPFARVPFWRLERLRSVVRMRLPLETDALLKTTSMRRSPDRLARVLMERMAWERHTCDGFAIPTTLWTLVGTAAWNAPDFQFESADIVRDHLTSRLMVTAADFPVPRLRPEAMWLLVATARVRRNALARLLPWRRRVFQAIAQLQPLAESIVLQSLRGERGVALWQQDLWAQWIAWHVCRADPPMPHDLYEAIHALPLVSGNELPIEPVWTQLRRLNEVYEKWYPIGGAPKKIGRIRKWLRKARLLFERMPKDAGKKDPKKGKG